MSTNEFEKDPYASDVKIKALPKAFVSRRLQSLMGLFLILFIIEHLLTNSQAALFFGDDGKGFIQSVNFLHSLPYLQVIEILLLAVPIVLHTWWGIRYVRQAKLNSGTSDGSTPSLPYSRNYGYTWQRITAILLVVGIALHVYYMRFYKEPVKAQIESTKAYMVRITEDPGVYTLEKRLDFQTYNEIEIKNFEQKLTVPLKTNLNEEDRLQQEQLRKQKQNWVDALKKKPLQSGDLIAACPTPGTAMLLVVRDTFKSIPLCIIYSVFVIITVFHACNGLWTAMIAWGITLSERSRKLCRIASNGLMMILLFLGLVAIWGTYWINLYR